MARIKRMGEAYSAGDVVVTVPGMYDVNPNAVTYGYNYEHKRNYGLRRKARSWSMGKEELEGKLNLPLDVIAEFEKIAPQGNIALIRPFPTSVVFFNAENEQIRDIVWWKFTGNKREVTVDGELENEYEMFVTDLQLNI